MQNSVAKTICHVPRKHHLTPTLKQINWLPLKLRIIIKIVLISFKILHKYLNDLVHPNTPIRTLRSSFMNLPSIHNKYGSRFFTYACLVVWNSQPKNLCAVKI